MIEFIQYQQRLIEHLHWTTMFWLMLPTRFHSQSILKSLPSITYSLPQTVNSHQQTNCWQCVLWPISTDSELISMVMSIKIQYAWSPALHMVLTIVGRQGWKFMPLSSRNLNSVRGMGRHIQRPFWRLAEFKLYTGCCGVRTGTAPRLGIQGSFWHHERGLSVNQYRQKGTSQVAQC